LGVQFLSPKEFVGNAEILSRKWSSLEAAAYTKWLATHHYENFHVVSFLLPKRLHQDFYNVYAFCRWADDLGDEIGDREESLRLLGWWRKELDAMFQGRVRHPVFVALVESVRRHELPRQPFRDLIVAFVQDQTVTRYRTFHELYEYCRCSANPVGRLVLHLCGYWDPERLALSDETCTGLQLANFWQDVAVDWRKGRLYIPLELLERHSVTEDEIGARNATPAFRAAMREAVEVARSHFLRGLPLSRMVDRKLALDLELFSQGGLRVLAKIEQQDYDVLSRRPVISRGDRARLLASSLFRTLMRSRA